MSSVINQLIKADGSRLNNLKDRYNDYFRSEIEYAFNKFGFWQKDSKDKCSKVVVGIFAAGVCIATEAAFLTAAKSLNIIDPIKLLNEELFNPQKVQLSTPLKVLCILPASILIIPPIFFAPALEEELFRHRLPQKIDTIIPSSQANNKLNFVRKYAALSTAVTAFSLYHLGNQYNLEKTLFQLISTFAMGIIFTATYQRYGQFSSFVAHSVRNIIPIIICNSNAHDSTAYAITIVAIPVIAMTVLIAETRPLFKDFVPQKFD